MLLTTEPSLQPGLELLSLPDSASRRNNCLLYTSDAADDLIGVDLGGRRIIKKKRVIA